MKLEFTHGALQAIARCAIEKRTGARGLRTIMVSHNPCPPSPLGPFILLSFPYSRNSCCWNPCLKLLAPTSLLCTSVKTLWLENARQSMNTLLMSKLQRYNKAIKLQVMSHWSLGRRALWCESVFPSSSLLPHLLSLCVLSF